MLLRAIEALWVGPNGEGGETKQNRLVNWSKVNFRCVNRQVAYIHNRTFVRPREVAVIAERWWRLTKY